MRQEVEREDERKRRRGKERKRKLKTDHKQARIKICTYASTESKARIEKEK